MPPHVIQFEAEIVAANFVARFRPSRAHAKTFSRAVSRFIFRVRHFAKATLPVDFHTRGVVVGCGGRRRFGQAVVHVFHQEQKLHNEKSGRESLPERIDLGDNTGGEEGDVLPVHGGSQRLADAPPGERVPHVAKDQQAGA
mmetsp:Transcript_24118/g.24401  ORF Transcript_24118/g.24401 Transcript_24118/m.24401 type:complete len:141 (+) Transcript_24118:249-671(+)